MKQVIEQLKAWDIQLLLWINHAGSETWDTIFWYATKAWVGIPLYFIAFLWFWRSRGKKKALMAALLTALSVGITDLICGHMLKPAFGRLRPSHEPALSYQIRLVHDYRGGRFSFPSNHAANAAAGTLSFALQARHPLIWIVGSLWTILHSFTRVYLGVHYPSDILGGWVVGSLVAFILLRLYERWHA
ncbi:MAG: phosphatase PAP2 family protein [Bacteroidia bacterium]|nr:phosphatase PAP2 family protein [Bacteroidia bacterium]